MRRQDVCVVGLHYCGFNHIRHFCHRVAGKPLTRFLTFHDVPTKIEDDFLLKIRHIKKIANIVSLDDFLAGSLDNKRLNLVLTFDDGYRSWAEFVVPCLKKYSVPATFFICSGFVDLTQARAGQFAQDQLETREPISGGLTWAQVRAISEEGFTIGGHTRSHLNLSVPADSHQVLDELRSDRDLLEQKLGKQVRHFAFPFGTYRNPHVPISELLPEAGYLSACTLDTGFNFPGDDPFRLRRELTGVRMSRVVFRARISGAYDGITAVRSLLARVVPPFKRKCR